MIFLIQVTIKREAPFSREENPSSLHNDLSEICEKWEKHNYIRKKGVKRMKNDFFKSGHYEAK